MGRARRLENVESPRIGNRSTGDAHFILSPAFSTALGSLVVADCLNILSQLPDESLDLVVTSPPYDGQPKYGNGERYGRDWYEGFFLKVTAEVLRTLKPHGSFVLNYRSKRHGDERGTLQYELVFRLREQGFLFCEDFIWGKPSPPPGRFNRFLKDAVEYCFQFAKTPKWQFFPGPQTCAGGARYGAPFNIASARTGLHPESHGTPGAVPH